MKRLLPILLFAAAPAIADTAVTVSVSNVSTDAGQLVLSVYNSKKTWLKKPVHESAMPPSDETVFELELPAGDYAFQLYHDLDGNGKMKTNFIGIPKEPTAVSNEAKGKFGPPKFKDAAVTVGDEPVAIELKLVKID